MEIAALLEMCGCFLEGGNAVAAGIDLLAWLLGGANRAERRRAKKDGTPKPPLDGWNWTVIVLTPLVVLFTVLIVVRWAYR